MSHIVGLNTWGECRLLDYVGYLEADGWLFHNIRVLLQVKEVESYCPVD